ncbi:MAG TPA: hypothetical protein VN428_14120 [Bryobacteraceae bacterium]|nr:hypothetical protein [Bryobacteraceae bacterium]
MRILLLAALCLPIWAQTTVADTLYLANGEKWSGRVEISWDTFTSATGSAVAKGSKTITVTEGVLSIALQPNEGATPSGTAYTARYYGSRARWTEPSWVVPISATPVTLATVRKSSTLVIFPAQVDITNATTGDCMTAGANGGAWGPCASGAVTSVAGRDGAVVLAASDISGLGDAALLDVGVIAGTVAAGDDARLTNARTPTAHAASHATGQGDAISAADVGAAPSAKGVTNGDGHGHSVGDGAQIDYAGLANKPTLGTAAAAALGTGAGQVPVTGDYEPAIAGGLTAAVRGAISAGAPIGYNSTDGAFSMSSAGPTTDGYLSQSDYVAFAGKAAGTHAAQHATGQLDAIAPADIGAGTVSPETATYIPGDLAVFKNAAGTLIGTVSATGVLKISGSQPALAAAADITALYGGGSCAGYLKSDGTCDTHPITRGFGYSFNGGASALTAPLTAYLTVPFACTISAWNLIVDQGTATVDIWKLAQGNGNPAIANTITGSATPAIASGTEATGTTLTGWTTAVAARDRVAISLTAVSAATFVNLTVECVQ